MSGAQAGKRDARHCYHCGLPVAAGVDLEIELQGENRAMCCPGCLAVARAIVESGLADYYRHRSGSNTNPEQLVPDALAQLDVYDDPALQREFVRETSAGTSEITLALEGMSCAACAWLIERHLRARDGVVGAAVNLDAQRLRLEWDPQRAGLGELLARVGDVGYRARPFRPELEDVREASQRRAALRRLGVAGLGMVQVMMYAVGLYAGAFQGMEVRYRDFLRAVSALVTTPVVLYAARPFFEAAWRDLRAFRPGVDVPVSLAIGSAFLASLWATLTSAESVYFDSVCMFVFFLSLGRFLEMRVRHAAHGRIRNLLGHTPQIARVVSEQGERVVSCGQLEVGDRVLVRAGETLPADGVVREGESAVDESLLTGEPRARARGVGEAVIGGSQNVESPLVVEVSRVGAESTLAWILALLNRAQSERPALAGLAERLARYFVAGVLLTAGLTGLFWWRHAPEAAFSVTLSVLVVTCPCALSLATPAALAAASNGLAGAGLLLTRGHVLETLARVTRVIFDKTGTLTRGELQLVAVEQLVEAPAARSVALAGLVEMRSEHPIARALARWQSPEAEAARRLRDGLLAQVDGWRSERGRGVEAYVSGRRHRVGRADWACQLAGVDPPLVPGGWPGGSWVLLADEGGALAWFVLRDELRADARALIERLRRRNLSVELLSGDPSPAVEALADQLGIVERHGGAGPEQKRDRVRALQARGEVVAMLGDGVNDAPVLAQAQVSLAMGGGSDLARIAADAVVLGDRLAVVDTAIDCARRTRRVIRQNLGWALLYNLLALPLAASGYIAPHWAALGMSGSSLLVVTNAVRLNRPSERP